MNIVGIERIVYGVADLALCTRYLTDWGFHARDSGAWGADFATAEKTTVALRDAGDPSLPKPHHKSAFFQGSCGREVMWGVDTAQTLQRIAAELARDRDVREDSDGTLHSNDAIGNAIAFCVTKRSPVVERPLEFNLVGAPVRINRQAAGAAKGMAAHPLRINHVVYLAPTQAQAQAAKDFYIGRLGFRLSDNVGDHGFFMRPGLSHDHHNLLIECFGSDSIGLQHTAYEFRDLDHIMHRGTYLESQGWSSHVGPGRHTLGSNLTWYFWTPMGGLMELISDMDYVTDEWQPRFIDPKTAGPPIAWTARPNPPGYRFGVPPK